MSDLPSVFVSRAIPQVGLDLLRDQCNLSVWPFDMPPSPKQLREAVAGCHGILTLLSDRVDANVMDAAGDQLSVISNFAVGYNNIDVAEAKRRGIAVGNTPGALTEATADLAVTLVLAACRRIPEAMEQVRRHEWRTWEPLGLLGQELRGATLGIVGMGRIGLAVAERLHFGWNMNVVYTSRRPKPEADRVAGKHVSFDELLRVSDIVSIHCDLNDTTRHLFNAAAFARMKSTSVLVNTSRGGVIDQAALVDALRQGKPWGAALDVTDPEPLPSGHALLSAPNCMIVPHIGSATHAARNQMAQIAASNLLAGLHGEALPHPV